MISGVRVVQRLILLSPYGAAYRPEDIYAVQNWRHWLPLSPTSRYGLILKCLQHKRFFRICTLRTSWLTTQFTHYQNLIPLSFVPGLGTLLIIREPRRQRISDIRLSIDYHLMGLHRRTVDLACLSYRLQLLNPQSGSSASAATSPIQPVTLPTELSRQSTCFYNPQADPPDVSTSAGVLTNWQYWLYLLCILVPHWEPAIPRVIDALLSHEKNKWLPHGLFRTGGDRHRTHSGVFGPFVRPGLCPSFV